jgi:hypothetical protein
MITLKNFKIGLALILIPSIYTGFFPGKIIVITSICYYSILLYLLKDKNNFRLNNEFENSNIIISYVTISLISLIRGILELKSLQDVSVMFGGTIFIMILYPLFIYLTQSKNILKIFVSIIGIALPLSLVTLIVRPTDGFMTFQYNASFCYIFVFFIPYFKKKWIIITILFCIIISLYDITRRSVLLNISVCLFILFSFNFIPEYFFKKLRKSIFFLLVLAPVFFLILGGSGVFNIFKVGDNYNEITISSNNRERNLLVDSRTEIYKDVFSELSKKNAFIFGLGANGKTATSLTDDIFSNFDKIYAEGRRYTESGMLNQFQYSGFVGAISYWFLLTFASYNALFKSNNRFCKMLGLFMAFKVLYSFVEDQLFANAATFYMMFYIGLCYNIKFRNLNDFELKKFTNLIFN